MKLNSSYNKLYRCAMLLLRRSSLYSPLSTCFVVSYVGFSFLSNKLQIKLSLPVYQGQYSAEIMLIAVKCLSAVNVPLGAHFAVKIWEHVLHERQLYIVLIVFDFVRSEQLSRQAHFTFSRGKYEYIK